MLHANPTNHSLLARAKYGQCHFHGTARLGRRWTDIRISLVTFSSVSSAIDKDRTWRME